MRDHRCDHFQEDFNRLVQGSLVAIAFGVKAVYFVEQATHTRNGLVHVEVLEITCHAINGFVRFGDQLFGVIT